MLVCELLERSLREFRQTLLVDAERVLVLRGPMLKVRVCYNLFFDKIHHIIESVMARCRDNELFLKVGVLELNIYLHKSLDSLYIRVAFIKEVDTNFLAPHPIEYFPHLVPVLQGLSLNLHQRLSRIVEYFLELLQNLYTFLDCRLFTDLHLDNSLGLSNGLASVDVEVHRDGPGQLYLHLIIIHSFVQDITQKSQMSYLRSLLLNSYTTLLAF